MSRKYIKFLLICFNVIVCSLLFLFLLEYHKEEKIQIEKLIAERNAVNETAALVKEDNSNASESETLEEEVFKAAGISYRGDSFCDEDLIATDGIGAYLDMYISNEIVIQEYSMYESGSMSQMKLAGVDSDICMEYLKKHEDNGTSELHLTERKIRDLDKEELKRTDKKYVPVLCVGYYGGWGNDLEELYEQQQYILDTYSQKEHFLIVGITPEDYSDYDEYDKVMEEKWGEHYLSLNGYIEDGPESSENREIIAELIIGKLIEMGYIASEDVTM